LNNDPPHPPILSSLKLVRDRGQFAGLGHQQLLKPGRGQADDPQFATIRLRGKVGKGMPGSTGTMKTFTVAAALLALIVMPAHAQMGGKRHQGDEKKADTKKPAVDEKANKAALERIPEPKEKYDPWGVARPGEPAKRSK
jgi:hypothetical protein